ncbi:amino acid permease [Microbacterium sp. Leaf161]|uniref:amino acid permease n=1 Tax=Microbacterium sp. Leaf161 TaxID=1736281 RepID=UPI0006F8578E|nr:amino acid permease [Microbacterium sp. Leaf161]KQR47785.1 amino acid permease [Microbacterium sp. Leaf161]
MAEFSDIQTREIGLQKALTARQLGMIALGGAIGTGLFLGSRFAIGFAGPSVVLSYLIGGVIALLLMAGLAEMTVQHPTSGSFGAYAEHYIGPLAGFLVRYMYWACIVLAVGTEVTAVGEYMQLWFPDIPPWIWVILFGGALILVNAMNVKSFGTLEYWFSAIKVFAIIAFIVVAGWLVFFSGDQKRGVHSWATEGGFMPNGLSGMWFAVIVSIFSYLSIEMIAVAAGEAAEPERAVKKAFKVTAVRLLVFYILTLSLIVSIAPVSEILSGSSPFVTVMQVIGVPFADSVLNFVVIIAALSAMNSQLYISTRMMFSLSRAGEAPRMFGQVGRNGAPLNALLLSTGGIAVATVIYVLNPADAFAIMFAISMFGALFTWFMIFATHVAFRRRLAARGEQPKYSVRGSRPGAIVGAVLMLAIAISTALTDEFRATLPFGLPCLAIAIGAFFLVQRQRRRARDAAPVESAASAGKNHDS